MCSQDGFRIEGLGLWEPHFDRLKPGWDSVRKPDISILQGTEILTPETMEINQICKLPVDG